MYGLSKCYIMGLKFMEISVLLCKLTYVSLYRELICYGVNTNKSRAELIAFQIAKSCI